MKTRLSPGAILYLAICLAVVLLILSAGVLRYSPSPSLR